MRMSFLLFVVACGPPPAGTFETFELEAEAVDETFTLNVFAPDAAAPGAHVVYLFDGDDWTRDVARIVTELEGEGVTPPLVVGIGYGDRPNQRERDLTPAPHGHVDDFFTFLTDELVVWVDDRYDTTPDPAQRTVLGHSFGGAAAVYGLLAAADTFGSSVAISPSLTLAEGVLFDLEAEHAAQHDDLVAHAYLSAGALEAWGMAGLTEAMGETLSERDYPSLKLRTELWPGRVHADVFRPAATDGLRFVLEAR